MENRSSVLKGALLVGLGASCYGMLATFVKLAYSDTGVTGLPYTLAEVVSAQFALGLIGMAIFNRFSKSAKASEPIPAKNIRKLMLAGTSTGCTSILYYFSVQFIPVSIAIVLLMQTVWMAVLLEAILERKMPSGRKIVSVLVVLAGTALATGLSPNTPIPDWRGLAFGLAAAASFTTTMYAANRIATDAPAGKRSLFMLCGGAIVVSIFVLINIRVPFNYDIFYSWGLLLSLFGTILPPILLNAGFPRAGIGLGSIVSALELPVSVGFAWLLLSEKISGKQWFGIGLILLAIVLMNLKLRAREKSA